MLRNDELTHSNDNPICLVVPLTNGTKPYIASRSRNEAFGDELVIPMPILEELSNEAVKSNILSYAELIASHQSTTRKIRRKNMGAFGIGAFAEKKINKGELLVYAGFYAHTNTVGRTNKDQEYLAQINSSGSILVDGRMSDNNPRYFQHLPEDDDIATAPVYGDGIKANFLPVSRIVKIEVDGKCYCFPIYALVAKETIPAGEIVGYSYSMSYWKKMNLVPAVLKPNGDAHFVFYFCSPENEKAELFFKLDAKSIENFQLTKSMRIDNSLILFPSDSADIIFSNWKLHLNNQYFPFPVPRIYFLDRQFASLGKIRNKPILTLDVTNCNIEEKFSTLGRSTEVRAMIVGMSPNSDETGELLVLDLDLFLKASPEAISTLIEVVGNRLKVQTGLTLPEEKTTPASESKKTIVSDAKKMLLFQLPKKSAKQPDKICSESDDEMSIKRNGLLVASPEDMDAKITSLIRNTF